jgi:hypothetical protein
MKPKKEIISLIVIIAGFFFISFLFKNYLPLIIVTASCLPGFFFSSWAKKIHGLWMELANILGWVNSRIILFIIFFFILTPIAFFARISGKISFVKTNKNKTTLFINRNHLYVKNDFENPW